MMEDSTLDGLRKETKSWKASYERWSRNHKVFGYSAAFLAFVSAYDFQLLNATKGLSIFEILIGFLAGIIALGMTFFDPSKKAEIYRDMHNKGRDALDRHDIGEFNSSQLLDIFREARKNTPSLQ